VYGAAASIDGELLVPGSDTGNVYGTFALAGVGSAWLDVAVPPTTAVATRANTPTTANTRRRKLRRRRLDGTYPDWILDSAEPLTTAFFPCKPTMPKRTHVTGRRRDQPTTLTSRLAPVGSLTSGNRLET
jgi:hypothetical protein